MDDFRQPSIERVPEAENAFRRAALETERRQWKEKLKEWVNPQEGSGLHKSASLLASGTEKGIKKAAYGRGPTGDDGQVPSFRLQAEEYERKIAETSEGRSRHG